MTYDSRKKKKPAWPPVHQMICVLMLVARESREVDHNIQYPLNVGENYEWQWENNHMYIVPKIELTSLINSSAISN